MYNSYWCVKSCFLILKLVKLSTKASTKQLFEIYTPNQLQTWRIHDGDITCFTIYPKIYYLKVIYVYDCLFILFFNLFLINDIPECITYIYSYIYIIYVTTAYMVRIIYVSTVHAGFVPLLIVFLSCILITLFFKSVI